MDPQDQPPSSQSKPVQLPVGDQVPPPLQPGHFPLGYTPKGYPLGYGYPPPGYVVVPPGYVPPSGYVYPPQSAPQGYVPAGLGQPHPMAIPSMISQPSPVVAVALEEDEEAVAVSVDEDEPTGEVYHPPALTHIDEARPRNAFVRAWQKIGGGSLTLSLAIHAGLILVAGLIVFTVQTAQKQVDFLPGGGTAQGAQASEEMKHKVKNKKRSTISKSVPLAKVMVNGPSDISLPSEPPSLLEVPDVSSALGGTMGSGGFGAGGAGGGFGKGIGMGGAAGFVSLPPSMRSRCSASERLEKLRQTGGRPECEAAVTKSLAWLKSKQNPDGSWGRANKCAMTGLVLLCYLGRCETPDSPFYGDNVMKAILYLIEVSKKNEWGFITENPKSSAGAYEHGIATYALGEMYTLARLGSKSLPGMREAFEKGVELVIKTQNAEGRAKGGWDYYTEKVSNEGKWKSSREDLSVTGWQYQALKAAKNTSLKINGLHAAISDCVDYLESLQTKDGGIGTTQRDQAYNQWSLTGCGVLGLQTLGKGAKKSVITKGMKFLREFMTAEPLDWNKNCNLYCWYYYTQAFFQAGGDDWRFYNEQFLPQILANQNPDGAWKPGRPNWPLGDAADAIYRQALCTLQLEVYYRYLKVADREDDSFFER